MYLFDVIIPTYNNCPELIKCLQSLERQTIDNFRAIVCIDGSTDDTEDFLNSYAPEYDVLILRHNDGQNHGRNRARNLSLPHIYSEYILFVDADVELLPECMAQHLEALKKRDCISVGDVSYTNANSNIWAEYLQTRGKNKYKHGDEIPPQYLITQNASHKSKYFIELRGQDDNITLYGGGDTEYALRLNKYYQLPTIFNALAKGESAMNKTFEDAMLQMENFGATNLKYLMKKFPENQSIFGVKYLLGYGPASLIIRWALANIFSSRVEKYLQYLPKILRKSAVHYCAASRIRRGYFR